MRHGVFLLNPFAVKASGRTPYEELHMTRYNSPLLQFGESVLARRIMDEKGKLASKWEVGIWLGRSTVTNEHLVGCPTGVIKVRTVKRRPE